MSVNARIDVHFESTPLEDPYWLPLALAITYKVLSEDS